MNRHWVTLGGATALLGVAVSAPQKASPTFERDVAPVMGKYCMGCHGGSSAAAGLSFAKLKSSSSLSKERNLWDRIVTNVRNKHMPPVGMPQPTAAQRAGVVAYLETALSQDCAVADPGRVTIRRLNRAEYNNTIRDLLHLEFRPADDFPSDDVGYGFDNIGDVLSISPLLMEKYLDAAETIATRAIVVPPQLVWRYNGTDMVDAERATSAGSSLMFYSATEGFVRHRIEKPGVYTLRVQAWAQQAGPDSARMSVKVDGKVAFEGEIKGIQGKPQVVEIPLPGQEPGERKISVGFLNDFYDAKIGDRNLIVDWVEIDGPSGGLAPMPASHQSVLPHAPKDAADLKSMLADFAARAYRRPARSDEVDRLMNLVGLAQKAGEPLEKGVQLAVQAVLSSPHFLFRVELEHAAGKKKQPIGDYELASRLSYFLWSSTPDAELLALAKAGKLRTPAVMNAQVARMLKDPRSGALAENFASQWLQLRKLESFEADKEKFPQFTPELRQDAVRETKMFFSGIVRNDRSVIDFLDGRYSYLNGRLAGIYGIPNVTGGEFRKVALADPGRAGVLTQLSVLTVTSNPTRTSPTKRGKWVLENFLGTPPPPPPPGVSVIPEEAKKLSAKTLRELMEQHRKNPTCASCHRRMDPIGFGLENFDPIGRWRTREGKFAIDSSGTLPDGRSFKGPAQLRTILLENKDQFVGTLAERLMTYALGRGMDAGDKCYVDAVVTKTKAKDYRFSALVEAIVASDPFRMKGTG